MCEDKPEDEIVQEIKEELGCEPHATIDCAGAVQAIRISLKVILLLVKIYHFSLLVGY